ncbi:very-long-chain 3-oxoacyl-CoA reductase 1 [Striga asiatica]|uniref:Very-long-chain 3-oxoacyl-CoA reductase 1 n=1 Tax=Striga asiatica TaxID=4170 RepID=A0A5A7RFT0_STRAF|nr:very-long-chain 3-oxoacyl-CoA reductase 1 [Striga asiatica]
MNPPNLTLQLSVYLGLIILSKSLLRLSRWIWNAFLRPEIDLKRTYGPWAMVTGSTDGIGLALAAELASRGLNLVLVARNPLKLRAASEEIRRRHPAVSIRTAAVDFDDCGPEEVARAVGEAAEGLDLGILVNNVGRAYPYARFAHEVDMDLTDGVVGVNVVGTTWVTKAVIGRMLARKGKGRKSVIVNVGSGSSGCVSSYPLYTIYAATKAYVSMLSRSLSVEYKHQGIDVQCQIPLLVATKMASIKKASLFIPSPETYSKASLRWIGHQEQVCVPYWPHALQAFVMGLLPEALLDCCLLRYFLGMRARGLRKDSQGLGRVLGSNSI